MITLDQIKQLHSKVKSGADFPTYIREIKDLGIDNYAVYVTDDHTEYYFSNGMQLSSDALYETLDIAATADLGRFQKDLNLINKEGPAI